MEPSHDQETIQLVSSEGEVHSLSKKAAELSKLLKGTIQDFQGEISIPLVEVDNFTTRKLIEYLSHYNGNLPQEIEKPLRSNNMHENTDEYSANFIDSLSLKELEDMTLAANFMEIQPLLDLCCAKYVALAKDKSEEELMKEFGITTSFTEEEKKKIKDENPWLDETYELK